MVRAILWRIYELSGRPADDAVATALRGVAEVAPDIAEAIAERLMLGSQGEARV
jgi:hypothetical protein